MLTAQGGSSTLQVVETIKTDALAPPLHAWAGVPLRHTFHNTACVETGARPPQEKHMRMVCTAWSASLAASAARFASHQAQVCVCGLPHSSGVLLTMCSQEPCVACCWVEQVASQLAWALGPRALLLLGPWQWLPAAPVPQAVQQAVQERCHVTVLEKQLDSMAQTIQSRMQIRCLQGCCTH